MPCSVPCRPCLQITVLREPSRPSAARASPHAPAAVCSGIVLRTPPRGSDNHNAGADRGCSTSCAPLCAVRALTLAPALALALGIVPPICAATRATVTRVADGDVDADPGPGHRAHDRGSRTRLTCGRLSALSCRRRTSRGVWRPSERRRPCSIARPACGRRPGTLGTYFGPVLHATQRSHTLRRSRTPQRCGRSEGRRARRAQKRRLMTCGRAQAFRTITAACPSHSPERCGRQEQQVTWLDRTPRQVR